ncbi:hypothetical protein, partial [Citrobacter freundii]|uniref:hypothetical protein n=1 Tax=Citrobacter freundii TaxID=546 RepID=UPI0023AF6673
LLTKTFPGRSVKWPEFGVEHQSPWSNMMKSRCCALIRSRSFKQTSRVVPNSTDILFIHDLFRAQQLQALAIN